MDSYERQLDRATRPVDRTIRVGYAQVGTESGWRLANNQSIRDAAREFGVDLTAIDADNDQQAQLEAVREFIRQRMDVIVISPIVDSGWDEVLMEARDAGIPVRIRACDTMGYGVPYSEVALPRSVPGYCISLNIPRGISRAFKISSDQVRVLGFNN